MAETRLWCLRHAECEDNVAGVLSSAAPGSDLTDLGRSQAAAAAAEMDPVVAVYASPTVRTVQTAAAIASRLGLEVRVRQELIEWGVGECEGRSDPAAAEQCRAVIRAWILDGDLDARIPGGDSGRELAERCSGGLREIAQAHPEETVAVVSHAGALAAALLAMCPDGTAQEVWGRPLRHAAPFLLTYHEGLWRYDTWPGAAEVADGLSGAGRSG